MLMEASNGSEAGLQVQPMLAPVELLAECVRCLMEEEHQAALVLCKKILQAEPGNPTALELLPLLEERLRLDEELSTESSSDEDDEEEESSSGTDGHSSSSSSGTGTSLHGCTH